MWYKGYLKTLAILLQKPESYLCTVYLVFVGWRSNKNMVDDRIHVIYTKWIFFTIGAFGVQRRQKSLIEVVFVWICKNKCDFYISITSSNKAINWNKWAPSFMYHVIVCVCVCVKYFNVLYYKGKMGVTILKTKKELTHMISLVPLDRSKRPCV